MVRQYPELRRTLTDLLIGDLFHDRVDKVWGPLESMYPQASRRFDVERGLAGIRDTREGERVDTARGKKVLA
jgi:hypothetical protein